MFYGPSRAPCRSGPRDKVAGAEPATAAEAGTDSEAERKPCPARRGPGRRRAGIGRRRAARPRSGSGRGSRTRAAPAPAEAGRGGHEPTSQDDAGQLRYRDGCRPIRWRRRAVLGPPRDVAAAVWIRAAPRDCGRAPAAGTGAATEADSDRAAEAGRHRHRLTAVSFSPSSFCGSGVFHLRRRLVLEEPHGQRFTRRNALLVVAVPAELTWVVG